MTPFDATAPPPTLGADFYKAHGLGNDYLVFPAGTAWRAEPAAVRTVCDRWRGPGADGIVCDLGTEEGASGPIHRLRMFNPDGSEFERSGNGLRVLAAYLLSEGRVEAGRPFRVSVGGDEIEMEVSGRSAAGALDVRVEMGRARVGLEAVGGDPEWASFTPARGDAVLGGAKGTGGGVYSLDHPELGPVEFTPVSVGNPHCVHLLPGGGEGHGRTGGGGRDSAGTDSRESHEASLLHWVGPFLCTHPAFAHGVNVQVATVDGPAALRIRIWERGVGETSASGTSACASAVAAVRRGVVEPGEVEVRMEGGTLEISVTPELDVGLRGPVKEVCRGTLTRAFLDGLVS